MIVVPVSLGLKLAFQKYSVRFNSTICIMLLSLLSLAVSSSLSFPFFPFLSLMLVCFSRNTVFDLIPILLLSLLSLAVSSFTISLSFPYASVLHTYFPCMDLINHCLHAYTILCTYKTEMTAHKSTQSVWENESTFSFSE